VLGVRPVEPRPAPGGSVALDDEGAGQRLIAIVVRIEGAKRVADEGLCQGRERPIAAVPNKAIVELGATITEAVLELPAHQRIDAIGADDEVEIADGCQRRHRAREGNLDAGAAGLPLQYPEQVEATNGG